MKRIVRSSILIVLSLRNRVLSVLLLFISAAGWTADSRYIQCENAKDSVRRILGQIRSIALDHGLSKRDPGSPVDGIHFEGDPAGYLNLLSDPTKGFTGKNPFGEFASQLDKKEVEALQRQSELDRALNKSNGETGTLTHRRSGEKSEDVDSTDQPLEDQIRGQRTAAEEQAKSATEARNKVDGELKSGLDSAMHTWQSEKCSTPIGITQMTRAELDQYVREMRQRNTNNRSEEERRSIETAERRLATMSSVPSSFGQPSTVPPTNQVMPGTRLSTVQTLGQDGRMWNVEENSAGYTGAREAWQFSNGHWVRRSDLDRVNENQLPPGVTQWSPLGPDHRLISTSAAQSISSWRDSNSNTAAVHDLTTNRVYRLVTPEQAINSATNNGSLQNWYTNSNGVSWVLRNPTSTSPSISAHPSTQWVDYGPGLGVNRWSLIVNPGQPNGNGTRPLPSLRNLRR